jgi:hypothetical protein
MRHGPAPSEVPGDNLNRRKIHFTEDMPKEHEIEDRPLRVPSFLSDVLAVALLTWLAGYGLGWSLTGEVRIGVGLGSAVALLMILWRAWRVYDKPISYHRETWWQSVMTDEEIVQSDPTLVRIGSSGGTFVEFIQPKAGEFAAWARLVVDDHHSGKPMHDRTTFSQNTGRSRGWTVEGYKSMVVSMELAGWLIVQGQYRVPTEQGIAWISSWLSSQNRRGDNGT